MVCRLDTAIYRPRRPLESDLHRLVREHFTLFRQHYPLRHARTHGHWRPVITKAVNRFLACGDLRQGFARARCPECRHEFLAAFSCKQRSICPSCHQKRAVLFGIHVAEDICRPVPHRQFVWTMPKRLRIYFRYHRRLLSELPRIAWQTIEETYRAVLGESCRPGAIIAVQTFGQLLHFHPHLHAIVTDGAFTHDGAFIHLPDISHEPFLRLWEHKLFALLLEKRLITPELVAHMRSWRHSGFGLNRRMRLAPGDAPSIERIARYIARGPFSLARLVRITPAGKVIYRAEKDECLHFPQQGRADLFAGMARNFEIFEPHDFLAELTQHIPDPGEHPIRYYGTYSNKARAKKASSPNPYVAQPPPAMTPPAAHPPPAAKPTPHPLAARRRWAALIKRIYHADPLLCPRCGATMKIISCLDARQDAVETILHHLGLLPTLPSRSPPGACGPPSEEAAFIASDAHFEPDGDFLEHLRREREEHSDASLHTAAIDW